MRTEHLKFPLHAEQTIRLPKGCKITGVTVTDDITFLTIEKDYEYPLLKDIRADMAGKLYCMGAEIPHEDHKLLCFFEGDYRVTRDELGNEVKTIIPIPEESDTLREIAVFETQEVAAVWHIFEEVKA